ncbi:MAG: immunoglobulin domain-containing protein [Opitutaceae bacterium]|nr:immunoglobulin domain-containing protein [Opitutaceae bacterium]
MTPLHLRPSLLAVAISLAAAAPVAGQVAVSVTIDPAADRAPISPWIYGTNFDLGAPVTAMRQGGNRMTGYNWENNASNAGSDYLHNSDNYLTWQAGITGSAENTPGIVVTDFHDDARSLGASYSVVTLQLAGYVARDKSGVVTTAQVAPSSRWVPISFAKPTALSTTPDTTDGAVHMDEFVHFLVQRYGSASTATGVRGYCLDNEPDLWSNTHARLHPGQPTCAELVARNVDGAKAIKRVDPAAETFGFVSYGFAGYNDFQGAPDWAAERTKGSYRWFVDYYLDQMKKASDTAGVRLLDAIDLHNYSEAQGGGVRVNDATTWDNIDCNKARMQAPRTYWDPTYIENSWIGQWFSSFLPLLPNVRSSIDTFYPGTKLALTEYNFGGESHISGGIAQADTLGIFADQGVYLATWWQLHTNPTYIAAAFRLYRDYDGDGSTYGDTTVSASVNDRATCSVHASVDAADPTRLHVILLNKSYDQSATASFTIAGTRRYTSARIFAFDSAGATITERAAVSSITNNTFTYTLPALTAAHLVLSAPADTPPTITTHPASTSVTAGGSATLTVVATAAGSGTLTYQWRLDGVDIAGATSAAYTLPSAQAFHAGSYTCVVHDGTTSTTSNAATLTVTPAPASSARLLNISTRALCLTGDGVLIPGFVLSGDGSRRMLIRAVGQRLAQAPWNLAGTLPDPQLTLKRRNPATQAYDDVVSNGDWGANANAAAIASTAASVYAFGLGAGSGDAAVLVDVAAGSYTVHASGAGTAATGIAIVEVYDTSASGPAIVNLSNRGHVGVGGEVMIPGFVISDEGALTLLIRAVGPRLGTTPFNLSGVLADPVLTIYRGQEPILSNDDWGSGPGAAATVSTAAAVYAFSLQSGSADAAFVVTLPPGGYTVQVTGKGGATGTALAELYVVP